MAFTWLGFCGLPQFIHDIRVALNFFKNKSFCILCHHSLLLNTLVDYFPVPQSPMRFYLIYLWKYPFVLWCCSIIQNWFCLFSNNKKIYNQLKVDIICHKYESSHKFWHFHDGDYWFCCHLGCDICSLLRPGV
jgi:hypothetical protein